MAGLFPSLAAIEFLYCNRHPGGNFIHPDWKHPGILLIRYFKENLHRLGVPSPGFDADDENRDDPTGSHLPGLEPDQTPAPPERAFSGVYWDCHDEGTYRCVVCDEPLFDSNTKFESGSGWPSFWDVMEDRKGNLWFATKDSGVYHYGKVHL